MAFLTIVGVSGLKTALATMGVMAAAALVFYLIIILRYVSGKAPPTGRSSTLLRGVANYQAALRSVTYTNTGVEPDVSVRTVGFIVNDGVADSNKVLALSAVCLSA